MIRISIGILAAVYLISCGGNGTSDPAKAPGNQPAAKRQIAGDAITMKVALPSMQCETCAETITKAVQKVDGVEKVSVDVDAKTAFVQLANATPEMQTQVRAAISRAGYRADNIPADPAAYEKLDDCCKETTN